MPRLIPMTSIGVSRKVGSRSQTVFPPIGELYDFTDEEVKQIRADNPEGLRKPINETVKAKEPEPVEVTSEDDEEVEDEGVVTLEEEEIAPARSPQRMTPQQRQREAQAQRANAQAARRPGVRRTNMDDDL